MLKLQATPTHMSLTFCMSIFIIYALHGANVDPSHESMWHFGFLFAVLHGYYNIYLIILCFGLPDTQFIGVLTLS